MSLDQNLFTLVFTQSPDNPHILDLVDTNGTAHYRKERVPGPVYKINVYEPLSESLLASVTAPSATSKAKTIELFNPTLAIEMKYTGTLSFRWSFKWEEHEFEWRREECYLIRKPDPAVLVAVTKEPAGRIKTSTVQLLDYNLNRFDIEDRKGLEIVLLSALLTFQDSNDVYHSPKTETPPAIATPVSRVQTFSREPSDMAPPPPPRPAPKTGADRIAEMQAIRGEINEVAIEEEDDVKDYAQYCFRLLQDEAMLFITIRSLSSVEVPKVLQVVEETKRQWYKSGMEDVQELHQYVVYDTKPETRKGPRIINLDDPPKGKGKEQYAPPTSLVVHLSKIAMPELQPKIVGGSSNVKETAPKNSKEEKERQKKEQKEREKAKKEQEKAKKDERKEPSKLSKKTSPSTTPSSSSRPSPQPALNSRPRPPSPNHKNRPHTPHVHSHEVHPYQPSPSPAQINNPSIYAAPPPQMPHPQPSPTFAPASHSYQGYQGGHQGPPPPPPMFLQLPANQPQRPNSPGRAVDAFFDMLSSRRW